MFDLGFYVEALKSSQLYLETVIPSMGNVFCLAQNYSRAVEIREPTTNNKRTHLHLAEYTHLDAECPFITFKVLQDRLEDLVSDVVERVLKTPYKDLISELNPKFKPPTYVIF